MRCSSICRRSRLRTRNGRRAPSSRARGADLAQDLQEEILAETLAIVRDPRFAPLFRPGSLAEVPVVAKIGDGEDGYELEGQIDRLAILEDELLILDYKTNRPPPKVVEEVAPAYIDQLASYRLALKRLFPGRRLACSLAVDRRTQPHGNPINFA